MTNSTRAGWLRRPRFRCLATNLCLRPARDTRRVSLHPNIVLAVRSGVVEDRTRIPMLISWPQSPPEVKGATGVSARGGNENREEADGRVYGWQGRRVRRRRSQGGGLRRCGSRRLPDRRRILRLA